MMYINTTGLVLRETAYKDSSKILTILTEKEGKLTVSARGALRKNSKFAAATQLLVYSEMTLVSARDRWTLTEARCVEQFIGLRSDVALLSLGAYFAELTEAASDEDSPNPELLPLCLNALFALSERIKEPEFIKPSFELRLMSASGFAPLAGQCSICGSEKPERVFLDIDGGTIRCAGHEQAGGDTVNNAELSKGALDAMRYIIGCSSKRLFAFTISEGALRELTSAAERYLLAHLDRSFRTLEFYKNIEISMRAV